MTDTICDIIIIGGGPAGMSAAAAATAAGQKGVIKTLLLERNEKTGKKLYITGKGRCNVTNDCSEEEFLRAVVSNPKFLYGAIYAFNAGQVMDFFAAHGVPLKTERGGRVFPASDKASDIIRAFNSAMEKTGVDVMLNTRVMDIRRPGTADCGLWTVNCLSPFNLPVSSNEVTSKMVHGRAIGGDRSYKFLAPDGGSLLQCRKLIIACGGLSYPSTGSTGDGYKFAAALGHTVVAPLPSLVPIIVSENFIHELQGLSLRNIGFYVKKCADNRVLYKDFGELVFTGNGVSGPVVLSASAYINRTDLCELYISIDLKPALSPEKLDARIMHDFSVAGGRLFRNSLAALLPKSLIPVVATRTGIPAGKTVTRISREERARLVSTLKDFRLTPVALGGFDEAVVTAGGVDVREVNPKTMESRLVPGLYFAGETLDTDALTGGFNIQTAMSTGWLAGTSAAASLQK